MAYFKLDIPKVTISISRYKETKKNYMEDLQLIYGSLSYIDSAWNDANSPVFMNKVKNDQNNLNNYFDYLNSLYDEIQKFVNNIDYLCAKQGYMKETIVLKFDDSEVNNCISILINSINLLDESLSKININLFKPDFEYLNLVYVLRSEITSIKNLINNLIVDIVQFVKSVNNEIEESRNRVKRLGEVNFKLDLTEYIGKIADLDVRVSKQDDIQMYNNSMANSIKNFADKNINVSINDNQHFNNNNIQLNKIAEINRLSNNVNTTFTNPNSINLKKQDDIEGLNNNINTTFANSNTIDMKDVNKAEGLNDNINMTLANSNTIDMKDVNKAEGLNDNINMTLANSNTIDMKDVNRIEGLNDNVTLKTANTNNIDFNQNEISSINKNINSYSSNESKIIFETQKNIDNLNSNVSEVSSQKQNINFQANTTIDNSIDAYQTSTNSINLNSIPKNNIDLNSGITTSEAGYSGISGFNSNINLNSDIKAVNDIKDIVGHE